MLITGAKFLIRWSFVTVSLLGVGLAVLIFLSRFTPIPLGLIEGGVAYYAGRSTGTDVKIENAQLLWSEEENFPALRIGGIEFTDSDDFSARFGDVFIAPSRRAFFDEFIFAVKELSIASVDVMASDEKYISPPSGFTIGALGAQNIGRFNYLQRLDVQNIHIAAFNDTNIVDEAGGSYVIISRDGDTLVGALDVKYQQNDKLSRLDGQMNFRPGEEGFFDLNLDDVNPRDIGNISRLFQPLRALSLPMDGKITFGVNGKGELQKGRAEITISPGVVNLSAVDLEIDGIAMTVDADFIARDFKISKANFDVAGVKGEIGGVLYYEFSEAGQVSNVSANLSSGNLVIHQPELFEAPIIASQVNAQINYNLINESLLIDQFTIAHGDGVATTSGLISFTDGVTLDTATQFGAMTREGVMRLWPIPVGKRSRKWASENLSRGQVQNARLALRVTLDELVNRPPKTPLRPDALQLDMVVDDIDVLFLKTMPPIVGTRAELSLDGRGLRVASKGGQVMLPAYKDVVPPPLTLSSASIDIDDFTAPGLPAKINLQADGQISAILRTLNEPPVKILRKVNFDIDRLQGDVSGAVDLTLNLDNRILKKPPSFVFDGQSTNVSVDGQLGNFSLSDGRVLASVNNQLLTLTGRARANNVDLGFEWQQPMAPKTDGAPKPRLAIHGQVEPQELADLGFAWVGQRIKGPSFINVLAEGPIDKPTQYRVMADLQQAALMPVPLAYEKPVGEPAYIKALVRMDGAGKVSHLRTRGFINGEEKIATQLAFTNGVISDIKMTPISLGRTQGLNVSLTSDQQGRHFMVSAEQFDASAMIDAGNAEVNLPTQDRRGFFDFLGDNAVVEMQVDKVVGGHDESLDSLRLHVVRRDQLFEKVSVSGVFADGTELLGSVDRVDIASRRFILQTENASSLFRLLDVLDGVIGGSLALQGRIYDDERDDAGNYMQSSGRFDLVSFRARKVSTLAKILSIGSFQGFADTLAGEGIQFDRAEFKFSIVDNLFRVKGGRMFGPAIGLTTQGDYDIYNTKINFGGTVVPAYGLNSLLSNVPLVGRILTGREGEGVWGVGYRVIGRSGDPTVVVNPLSILTPGIFRRIFEVGIGLSPDGTSPISDDYPTGDD